MKELFNYFVNHKSALKKKHLPKSVAVQLKRLTRHQRDRLKLQLTETAKTLDELDKSQAIDWLQTCTQLINEHAFHFNRVFFSPGNEIKNEIKYLLEHAHTSVDLCIFTITDNELAQKIKACHKRGVKVRIITDDEKTTDNGSEILKLAKAGIPVKIDHSHYHMHNKFGIIDERIAITGSFNWTYTATKHNQENLLATSKFEIVKQYNDEFERLWDSLFPF
ncbi:phospholipase D-like domain-containing protein [uncultured Draconibacterium sp.]|mgnify:CR=1 FL=1|uniref:phospholipase D-like domain-containing protein n=1 Tax=uncultured Draconibacterium sp. TaxID=1573823 RepID=UPI0025F1EC5B|nr:phospholipase D-like domain-containing protein [uncultured Draconibacterium sp.]